ncbi:MAG: phosphatidylglycerol:prolipoprotein diacylglycerol transferase [Puniceicoccaceae bacterium 5H]|nr:MAG: phosphatidylglycerol:prolipoprotein diacylglycerol transferase [Puniceicoccaceae bacterium 5H]
MDLLAGLAFWVHDLDPFIFQIREGIGPRWYGAAYLVGLFLAWWLLRLYYQRGRSFLDGPKRETLFYALVIGVFAGGRLGYAILYRPSLFWPNPLKLFEVWDGGMASHGGFIGVALALCFCARRFHFDTRALADIVATTAPPGLFFGRIANFINGELWGKVTDFKYAVIFPDAQQRPYFRPDLFTTYSEQLGRYVNPRHASQLYEAALEGLVLFVYMQLRFWTRDPQKVKPGHLTGEFLIAYAILRMIGEVFREPDASLILGLSRGTFYSVVFILVGVGLILVARRSANVDTTPQAAAK